MAMVLDAFASYVADMLKQMAQDEVDTLLGVSGEIDKLGVKLRDLKNFLTDAERRRITDVSVQGWVRELKEVMYDATDILDLCQLKAMEHCQPSAEDKGGCCNPLLFCLRNPLFSHDIGNRIKKLNQNLDGIKQRSAAFNFINLGAYELHRSSRADAARLSTSRETSGELDRAGIVGEKIEQDTRSLVKMLTKVVEAEEDKELMVLAIVGVGGIGKTTLAKKVFNDDIIEREFHRKIWVSVNQDFSEAKLLRRAITDAGGDHHAAGAGDTKTALERALKSAVNGQKILLVMDDVWSVRAWEGVFETPLLNVVALGSRVLVTTRHDTIARGMKAVEPFHHVDKLEPEDAWLLLKKQVVSRGTNEHDIDMLKDIGMKIISNCDCLPLAVKVMGGLLCQRDRRRSDWEKVLKDTIWSATEMPRELNYAVYLSYEDLPPPLKQCFLHYSLLPKNEVFFKDIIVSMWISEGFVHGNLDELEDLGDTYYEELIWRNLIEPDTNHIDEWFCHMHDVVRSFAQYVARDEALVAQNREADFVRKLNAQKFIRLSMQTEGSQSQEFKWRFLQEQKSLRTLILICDIKINPGDTLSTFTSLRTLHIESGQVSVLVKSLYQLKHLRYLSIHKSDTSSLPENIGKMRFLQHINLSRCQNLVKLPGSIKNLVHLRSLSLANTSIHDIPRGFHGLTNLRTLRAFPAHSDGDWCSLEELGPLSLLRFLYIVGLEKVCSVFSAAKANLADKVHLTYLYLECASRPGEEEGVRSERDQLQIEEVFDVLCPPPGLDCLSIEGFFGRRLPKWMMSSTEAATPLKSLRILYMEDLPCCTQLPDGFASNARALKKLFISKALRLSSVGNFASLVKLGVLKNPVLERIADLPKLQELRLIFCPKMKVLEGVPALQRLVLEDYDMETLPEYMKDVNPAHLLLDCSLALLTRITMGQCGPEWDKLSHIQQVKAYADDGDKERKWYVLYTKGDPTCNVRTNISL